MALLAAELGSATVGFARTSSATTAPAATWVSSLEAAMLQQAKATNRPLLAIFSGSDWCKPCITLRQEVFDKPASEQFARDKFVLAHFDFPRSKKNRLPAERVKQNELAAARLNQEGVFPLVRLLSPAGRVLAKTGYRPGGEAAYQKVYLNDEDMKLANKKAEVYETNFESYREGAGGVKVGSGN